MKRYVVTGGAGFIGSALVRRLLAQGDGEVHVIDNLFSGHEKNLDEVRSQVNLHRLDIRDYAGVSAAVSGADVVVHLAAIPSVPRSIHDPVPSHEVNMNGTFNVFRACAEAKVRARRKMTNKWTQTRAEGNPTESNFIRQFQR